MSGKAKKRPIRDDAGYENGVPDKHRRPKIDPDERDEYAEWRLERGSRGRKRRDKADGRHQRRRTEEVD
jgi:hypothetical protein